MVMGTRSNENTAAVVEEKVGEKQQPSPEIKRNPRWTQQETMVLLEAKRIAEARGQPKGRRSSAVGSEHQEPKWDFVSSHCKQNGVNREPVQCRKRWSNLASDFRKIKQWESQVENGGESYWNLRTESRRERKLPGVFDKDVYDFWDGNKSTENQLALVQVNVEGNDFDGFDGMEMEDLDSTEDDETEEDIGAREKNEADGKRKNIPSPTPISEMRYQTFYQGYPNQGEGMMKPGSNFWGGSPSQKGAKKRRQSTSDYPNSDMENQLIKALERNFDMMNELLKAQTQSWAIDREQRAIDREQQMKQHDNLMGALGKMTEAMEKLGGKSDSK